MLAAFPQARHRKVMSPQVPDSDDRIPSSSWMSLPWHRRQTIRKFSAGCAGGSSFAGTSASFVGTFASAELMRVAIT
jgi:hypothetical protein